MRQLLLAGLLCSGLIFPTLAAPRVETLAGTGKPGFVNGTGPADQAQLRNPYGLTLGPDGALYICDMENHVIRRLKDGRISTVAGSGERGYSGDGGPPLEAKLNEPYEVRFDLQGNMFFVEMKNHLVRRVNPSRTKIDTVAGNGTPGFSGDGGPATKAQVNQPHSIQLDRERALYICDIGNHRIRKVNLETGTIHTFAGTGAKQNPRDGGRIDQEPLFGPRAIDFDRSGNLWLALREGNAIYKLDLTRRTVHHMAGTGKSGFRDGPAREATLSGPKGISIASDGSVLFADTESHSIRRFDPGMDRVETVVGTDVRGDGPDGEPLKCQLARPHGIFVGADGVVYIGDSENHRVRALFPN